MAAPKVKITGINNGSVIKVTNDQELTINFTPDQPELEYSFWTDWQSGKFHDINAVSNNDGSFSVLLSCDVTGFYKFVVRYREKNGYKSHFTSSEFEVHVDPDWIYSTIVYNIFLRSYETHGRNEIKPGEGGTFADVIRDMDELADLGVGAIYLNPFHIIGDLYRKYNPGDKLPYYFQPGSPYSIKDPKSIDPEIAFFRGDDHILHTDPKQQFKKLVDAAHRRGMRVIMDLVFNHTAHDFVLQRIYPEWFLYKENITSATDPYIYFDELKDGKPWGDAKHTVVPYDHDSFSWTDTAQLNWEYMLPPAPNKPPANTSKLEMYEYFKSIPKYWVKEFGIDGFRCDVAYKIPPDFWRACIKETREFAKECYPENGAVDGEVIFIAESFHLEIPELFNEGFSLVYGDYSNKIFTPLTLKGYLDYIYNLGTNDFPKGAKWFIFPECHDFSRATSKLVPHHLIEGENKISEKEEYAMRTNTSRWVLTACLPGMPMIFAGFEVSEWKAVEHVSYSKIDWKKAPGNYAFIRKVNKIRNTHPALQKGDYHFLETSDQGESGRVFAFMRSYKDEVMIIVVNMSIVEEAANVEINLPRIHNFDPEKHYLLKDLLSSKIYDRTGSKLTVNLKPGKSHIFLVDQSWG